MARNLNMAFFVAMAAAAMVMNSAVAATTYQVGDATGWTIPSGGATYTAWASNKTFAVGDILVFAFASNIHDVAEVTKASFDSCGATNPISLQVTSPARITLGSAGEKYYICTFAGHCTAGQKLSINVTGASSPAPAPSTTTPPPSPTPSPPASVPAPAPSTSTPPPASAPTPSSSAPTPSSSAPTPSAATPPSGAATPPSGETTPSGAEGPPAPPPSAAVSLGGAGLAGTFLSIALVLLY